MDIPAWLASLGLERYAQAFAENEIDAAVLRGLTGDDLKEMGVVAVGHRRKLLDAIAALPAAAAPAAKAAPPIAASDAERRHLTLMFVDLVGSTQLSTRLDPEDMRAVIIAYQNAVAAEIARLEGSVAKYMGDGVLAYFGWPKAHENEGERAVRAGLAIAAAIARQNAPDGQALSARIGIATGLVVVGDLIGDGAAQEQAVVGDTPNLAARLQSLAAPGQVVISDATRRLVAGMFDLTAAGEHELKGIAGRTKAFAVSGERALESRFAARAGDGLAALIGRDQELAAMKQRWSRSADGEGQFVLLSGEAGIGKSRIAEALIEQIATEPHHRIRYQCSPYHVDSALHPAIQQLNFATAAAATDTAEQRLDKLETHLRSNASASGEDVALIAALLGIDAPARLATLTLSPQQQRFRTLSAIASHARALAKDKPLLLVVEDAHWIDPTTRDLIELVLETLATARVFLLITTRPGAKLGLTGHPALNELVLNRLTRADVAAMAQRIGGGRKLPAALIDEIAAKSDGVPLYVEEMAKSALESGLLTETAEGYAFDRSKVSFAIPATLQDSLMSRLDRLSPLKEVAQTASIIGRSFDFRTLAAIAPLREDELASALDRLVEAELIFRQGIPPDANYLFKHALVRDAAYESLLKAKRQLLHERLVAALEKSGGAAPEILAIHAQAANMAAKAVVYWQRAGDVAMARPAYQEAIANYTNAAALAATLPGAREQELELQTKLGLASISAKGHAHPDTRAIFEMAQGMLRDVRRPDLDFVAWYGLWCGHHVGSEIAAARESAKHLFTAGNAVGENSHRMMGTRALAMTALMGGDFAEALRRHDEAFALHDPDPDRAFTRVVGQEQSVSSRSYHAINLWVVGREDEAWQRAEESVRLAKEIDHANSLGYGFMHATLVALCARRPEFPSLTAELIAISTEHRLQMWREFGLQFDAIRRLGDGDLAALADLKTARAALASRHAHLFSSLLALEAAHRLIAHGHANEALPLIDEAEAIIEASGERYAEAEYHRVRALHLSATGANAEPAFAEALRIARGQGAKAWEQRVLETARK